MPNSQQFRMMSDDQIVDALKMTAYAARLDVQEVKGVSQQAQKKTMNHLNRQTARVLATRWATGNYKAQAITGQRPTQIPMV